MERKFTIGEIGKIFNLSKDTLRYYDDIDLIKPWLIGENGYRYYIRAQFEMISTIIFLRNTGMPINELKQIITGNDIEVSGDKILHRKNQVKSRISELQKTLQCLDIMQEHLQSIKRGLGISVQRIPSLWTLSLEIEFLDDINVNDLTLMQDTRVREWMSFATVMSTIKPDTLLAGKFHKYNRYGYVSEHPFPFEDRHVTKIAKQLFICMNTTVSSTAYYKKDPTYTKLLKYIERSDYEVSGETIERNMFNLFNAEKKEFTHFYKVYVPIKG